MACSQIQPLLMDYCLQRLSPAEASEIDVHLGACSACRALLEEERGLAGELAGVPSVLPRQDLWTATRVRVTAPMVAPVRRAFRPSFRFGRAAAGLMAAGLAALALMLAPGRRVSESPTGTHVIAQTLEQVHQVSSQSDDPMGDMTDQTWAALSASGKGGPTS